MRYLVIGFLALLAGCNSSSNSGITQEQLDAAIAKVQASIPPSQTTQVQALQAKISTLKLIGKPISPSTSISPDAFRTMGEMILQIATVDFGPCADMGVFEGATFSPGNGPLGATFDAFKNCTNTHAEYDADTGELKVANRLYFTSADCSGIGYVWQEGGQGYNSQTLSDGVAFISPVDGSALWVQPGQGKIPPMVQAESAYVVQNGQCGPDGDFQPMWITSPNDTSKNGVPLTVGAYQVVAP